MERGAGKEHGVGTKNLKIGSKAENWKLLTKLLIWLAFKLGFVPSFHFPVFVLVPHSPFPVSHFSDIRFLDFANSTTALRNLNLNQHC